MSAPPTSLDRALAAFRALVKSVIPQAIYWIVHEYSVVESDGLTFSGLPTDAAFSPQLPTRVPYAPALAGATCVVPQGTLAYVGFANADPSKPYLVRFGVSAVPGAPGGVLPTSVAIDADAIGLGAASNTVVREGDQISLDIGGPTPGRISFIGASIASHSKVKA